MAEMDKTDKRADKRYGKTMKKMDKEKSVNPEKPDAK